MSLTTRLRKRVRKWARKRHGQDSDPFVVPTRRVYILPTRLGLFYAGMLFLMFLGAMNYANNLALGLTFILASLGLVAMHHCQRNLAGVRIASAGTEPVFAGQNARFGVALDTESAQTRFDVRIDSDEASELDLDDANATTVTAAQRSTVHVDIAAPTRGRMRIDHLQISTRYPFGLFRAWTHVHIPMSCIVYPKPAARSVAPPLVDTDTGGAQSAQRGDEDFAGLRNFMLGDSPRHIAWKAYARGQALQTKQYSGTAVASHRFDWDAVPGNNTEAKLSQLARWIEDAHSAGRAYGLRLPSQDIPIDIGHAHRQRCLTALALFGLVDSGG